MTRSFHFSTALEANQTGLTSQWTPAQKCKQSWNKSGNDTTKLKDVCESPGEGSSGPPQKRCQGTVESARLSLWATQRVPGEQQQRPHWRLYGWVFTALQKGYWEQGAGLQGSGSSISTWGWLERARTHREGGWSPIPTCSSCERGRWKGLKSCWKESGEWEKALAHSSPWKHAQRENSARLSSGARVTNIPEKVCLGGAWEGSRCLREGEERWIIHCHEKPLLLGETPWTAVGLLCLYHIYYLAPQRHTCSVSRDADPQVWYGGRGLLQNFPVSLCFPNGKERC